MIYPCKLREFFSVVQMIWAQGKFHVFKSSPLMTLKMRSRSPKSNQLLSFSLWYVHTSLVKFHLLVQEIRVREMGFRRWHGPRQQRDPLWNQYVPPHLRWWGEDIITVTYISRACDFSQYFKYYCTSLFYIWVNGSGWLYWWPNINARCLRVWIIVMPAKQKQDISIAFRVSSSSVKFLCLGHFLRNYNG